MLQPDLSVICDPEKLDERGCLGAPDLVVEILSPSTAAKDLKEKLSLYEIHGVKEYWVVDPRDRIIFVFVPDKSQNKLDDSGCQGAPDLVIEILSPATAARDLREKLTLYELSGVKEYWVVDPHDKVVMVFSLNKNLQFGKPQVYSSDDEIKSIAIENMRIKLQPVFKNQADS